ncbi:hypothetical protein ACN27G_15010 [Plantactinospora sp. WMMB334]
MTVAVHQIEDHPDAPATRRGGALKRWLAKRTLKQRLLALMLIAL